MVRIFLILVALCVPAAAQSKITEKEKETFGRTQYEMSACIAYLNFMKGCLTSAEEKGQLANMIKYLTSASHMIGRGIGMTDDAMLALLKIHYEEQAKLLNGNCVNFPSLQMHYGNRCKEVLDEGDSAYVKVLSR